MKGIGLLALVVLASLPAAAHSVEIEGERFCQDLDYRMTILVKAGGPTAQAAIDSVGAKAAAVLANITADCVSAGEPSVSKFNESTWTASREITVTGESEWYLRDTTVGVVAYDAWITGVPLYWPVVMGGAITAAVSVFFFAMSGIRSWRPHGRILLWAACTAAFGCMIMWFMFQPGSHQLYRPWWW